FRLLPQAVIPCLPPNNSCKPTREDDRIADQPMATISYTVAADFHVRADAIDAMKHLIADVSRPSLIEQGCQIYHWSQGAEDPTLFLLYMEWQDKASFEAHVATPHVKEAEQRLANENAGRAVPRVALRSTLKRSRRAEGEHRAVDLHHRRRAPAPRRTRGGAARPRSIGAPRGRSPPTRPGGPARSAAERNAGRVEPALRARGGADQEGQPRSAHRQVFTHVCRRER